MARGAEAQEVSIILCQESIAEGIADPHHFVRHPSVISPLTCEVALLVASRLVVAPLQTNASLQKTPHQLSH